MNKYIIILLLIICCLFVLLLLQDNNINKFDNFENTFYNNYLDDVDSFSFNRMTLAEKNIFNFYLDNIDYNIKLSYLNSKYDQNKKTIVSNIKSNILNSTTFYEKFHYMVSNCFIITPMNIYEDVMKTISNQRYLTETTIIRDLGKINDFKQQILRNPTQIRLPPNIAYSNTIYTLYGTIFNNYLNVILAVLSLDSVLKYLEQNSNSLIKQNILDIISSTNKLKYVERNNNSSIKQIILDSIKVRDKIAYIINPPNSIFKTTLLNSISNNDKIEYLNANPPSTSVMILFSSLPNIDKLAYVDKNINYMRTSQTLILSVLLYGMPNIDKLAYLDKNRTSTLIQLKSIPNSDKLAYLENNRTSTLIQLVSIPYYDQLVYLDKNRTSTLIQINSIPYNERLSYLDKNRTSTLIQTHLIPYSEQLAYMEKNRTSTLLSIDQIPNSDKFAYLENKPSSLSFLFKITDFPLIYSYLRNNPTSNIFMVLLNFIKTKLTNDEIISLINITTSNNKLAYSETVSLNTVLINTILQTISTNDKLVYLENNNNSSIKNVIIQSINRDNNDIFLYFENNINSKLYNILVNYISRNITINYILTHKNSPVSNKLIDTIGVETLIKNPNFVYCNSTDCVFNISNDNLFDYYFNKLSDEELVSYFILEKNINTITNQHIIDRLKCRLNDNKSGLSAKYQSCKQDVIKWFRKINTFIYNYIVLKHLVLESSAIINLNNLCYFLKTNYNMYITDDDLFLAYLDYVINLDDNKSYLINSDILN